MVSIYECAISANGHNKTARILLRIPLSHTPSSPYPSRKPPSTIPHRLPPPAPRVHDSCFSDTNTPQTAYAGSHAVPSCGFSVAGPQRLVRNRAGAAGFWEAPDGHSLALSKPFSEEIGVYCRHNLLISPLAFLNKCTLTGPHIQTAADAKFSQNLIFIVIYIVGVPAGHDNRQEAAFINDIGSGKGVVTRLASVEDNLYQRQFTLIHCPSGNYTTGRQSVTQLPSSQFRNMFVFSIHSLICSPLASLPIYPFIKNSCRFPSFVVHDSVAWALVKKGAQKKNLAESSKGRNAKQERLRVRGGEL